MELSKLCTYILYAWGKSSWLYLAFTTSDFDAFIVELNKRSIPFSDWPGTDGKITTRADSIKQVYIQDPEGYWIEVNSVDDPKD